MTEPNIERSKVVDVHTHLYPEGYWRMLQSRGTIPCVRTYDGVPDPRLIVLPAESDLLDKAGKDGAPLPGRPLTKDFYDIGQKLRFMDTHKIDVSVISLPNPWLDFADPSEAGKMAEEINQEFSDRCSEEPNEGRLYFFAVLPLTAPQETILASIQDIKDRPYCRGIILSTLGLGAGLDDPALEPIFKALADAGLIVFLHPRDGLPNEVWGPRASTEYGHVLPLALGFPMETTIAVARMYLAGVFDRIPSLRMLLAHSGGTLPFLAGRIESCVLHDRHLVSEGKKRRTVWEVLKEQVYLDAVVYSGVGLGAAVKASGADRLMFGTDHPFFPPVADDTEGEWESVSLNATAVKDALGDGTPEAAAVMGGNAVRVLRLHGK